MIGVESKIRDNVVDSAVHDSAHDDIDKEKGRRRNSVAIQHTTSDYDPQNATLPWYSRMGIRNILLFVFALIPAIPGSGLACGLIAFVDALKTLPSTDLGVWLALTTIWIEICVVIMKQSIGEKR